MKMEETWHSQDLTLELVNKDLWNQHVISKKESVEAVNETLNEMADS